MTNENERKARLEKQRNSMRKYRKEKRDNGYSEFRMWLPTYLHDDCRELITAHYYKQLLQESENEQANDQNTQ